MNNPTEKKIRRITPQLLTPIDYKKFNLIQHKIKPQNKPVLTYSLKKYYPVDSILDYRKTNNIEEYLIKWDGYDHSYNSWEPKKNLKCPELLKQFEEKMKINQNKNEDKFLNKKRNLIKKNTNQIQESNKENVNFLKEDEIKNKILTLQSFLNLI